MCINTFYAYFWEDMQKDNFFSTNKVEDKIILPEKVRKLQEKWIRNKTA